MPGIQRQRYNRCSGPCDHAAASHPSLRAASFTNPGERQEVRRRPLLGLGYFIARVLGLVFAVFAAALLYKSFFGILRLLRVAFPGGTYPPSTFTREQWMQRLQKASPASQQNLLLRTDHQSLGLRADEFLEVLREAAEHVKSEPALSVYWDRRDQLEQALRQERQG